MVTIIGFGISCGDHLTLKGLKMLQDCDVVFGPKGAIPPDILRTIHDFRDIVKLYQGEGAERRVTEAVLAEATRGKTAGLCTVGHPLIFDRPAAFLAGECRARGIECRVIPGISAVDAVLCELGYVVGPAGFQAHQALHLHKTRLDAGLPLFIFRFSELTRHQAIRSKFMAKLSKTYTQSHPVYLVESGHVPNAGSRIEKIILGELKVKIGSTAQEVTLFIPPL